MAEEVMLWWRKQCYGERGSVIVMEVMSWWRK